jgi:DNA-binding CsgD family transcriptional regulator
MEVFADSEIRHDMPLPEALGAPASALSLVMDELAHGVLITDARGRLLHANQAGHHELGRKRVLEARCRMLCACTPEGGKILQAALVRGAQGKRSLISLTDGSGLAVSVAVLPLKAEQPGQAPHVALLLARACVCEELMLCFFARSHALTPTEEQVLGILCQGFSAPQIALQMKVAVSTVRSHVRSLCAKTRSSGVRQLVNRVAVLPPLARALQDQAMH